MNILRREPDTFHEGEYHFQYPFIGDFRDAGSCQVDLYVGNSLKVNRGTKFSVTVIIGQVTATPPLQHYIEQVATKIRYSYFDKALGENIARNILLNEERIRWVEVLKLNGDLHWNQVTMKWDLVGKFYRDPKWQKLEPLIRLGKTA